MLEDISTLKYILTEIISDNPDDPDQRENLIADGFRILHKLENKVVDIIEDLQ